MFAVFPGGLILWHSQFGKALCLNVCLFVGCGVKKTWLTNTVEDLCVENMVNEYSLKNAKVTRKWNILSNLNY